MERAPIVRHMRAAPTVAACARSVWTSGEASPKAPKARPMTLGNVRSNESTGSGAMCPALTPALTVHSPPEHACLAS
eukprot:4264923-Prymnesium_polylepis.1